MQKYSRFQAKRQNVATEDRTRVRPMQSEGFHDWATEQLSEVGRIHTVSDLWKVGSWISSGLFVRWNIDAGESQVRCAENPYKDNITDA